MPHPESEHGLRVQLATALRERDEAREQARVAEAAWAKAKFRALPEYAQDTMDAVLARADVAESQVHASEMRRDAAESALAAANARADAIERDWRYEVKWHGETREALAAARRECEGLRAVLREEMERQHYVAAPGPESEDVDLCGGCGNAWPCEDADCFVFKARALLAAPAAASGEEGK